MVITHETKKVVFTFEGKTYTAELREGLYSNKSNKVKSFVHLDYNDNSDGYKQKLMDKVDELGIDSIYTKKGDYPEMDKLWKQYNNYEISQMRKILNQALKELGIEEKIISEFSRKCGCSCGCSPGFDLKVNWNNTLYIDYTEKE